MKNRRKKISFFLILNLIVIMLGSGCMNSTINDSITTNKKDKCEQVIDYLNYKYDDHFYLSQRLGGTFNSDKLEFLFTCDAFPDKEIWAAYCNDGTIIDNYVNIKYESQVNGLMREIIEDAFPEMDYYVSEGLNTSKTCVPGSSKDLSFNDFIKEPDAALEMEAFVDISGIELDKEAVSAKFEQTVVSKGLCMILCSIYFVDGFPQNLKTSMSSRDQIKIEESFKYKFHAEMDDANGFALSEWVR